MRFHRKQTLGTRLDTFGWPTTTRWRSNDSSRNSVDSVPSTRHHTAPRLLDRCVRSGWWSWPERRRTLPLRSVTGQGTVRIRCEGHTHQSINPSQSSVPPPLSSRLWPDCETSPLILTPVRQSGNRSAHWGQGGRCPLKGTECDSRQPKQHDKPRWSDVFWFPKNRRIPVIGAGVAVPPLSPRSWSSSPTPREPLSWKGTDPGTPSNQRVRPRDALFLDGFVGVPSYRVVAALAAAGPLA